MRWSENDDKACFILFPLHPAQIQHPHYGWEAALTDAGHTANPASFPDMVAELTSV